MPRTLSDETFQALRDIVKQIDFRAKRLQEWRTLTLQTQVCEGRFDVFIAKLKGAADPPLAPQEADLTNAWVDCDRDLIELGTLPGGFAAITLALADGSADPTVNTWIDALITTGKVVGTDLAMRRFGFADLKTHTAEYKAAYTKQGIQRAAKVQWEVTQLASLTDQLKAKFE